MKCCLRLTAYAMCAKQYATMWVVTANEDDNNYLLGMKINITVSVCKWRYFYRIRDSYGEHLRYMLNEHQNRLKVIRAVAVRLAMLIFCIIVSQLDVYSAYLLPSNIDNYCDCLWILPLTSMLETGMVRVTPSNSMRIHRAGTINGAFRSNWNASSTILCHLNDGAIKILFSNVKVDLYVN